MRLRFPLCLFIMLTAAGCQESSTQGTDASAEQASANSQAAGSNFAVAKIESPCSLLEPIASELFDPAITAPTVREATYSRNHVCRIIWEIPGADTAEKMRRAQSRELRQNNEVSLTVMGQAYGSAEEAVAGLEEAVHRLTEGVTVTVDEKERFVQAGFGNWLEGLGDRAIAKDNSILVAASGVRFTVAATLSDDPVENQDKAVDLARQIIEQLQ